MSAKLETDLLTWIDEESNKGRGQTPVPVQLLIIRLALSMRPDDEDLSRSIELALKTYEKAELLRVLRQLERKEWINFVDPKGTTIVLTDEQFNLGHGRPSDHEPTYVAITDKGDAQVKRIKLVSGITP